MSRELTNRDVLQITRTASRPAGGCRCAATWAATPPPAQARWSAPFAVPARYLATHATLAYATTAHAALGRTVEHRPRAGRRARRPAGPVRRA